MRACWGRQRLVQNEETILSLYKYHYYIVFWLRFGARCFGCDSSRSHSVSLLHCRSICVCGIFANSMLKLIENPKRKAIEYSHNKRGFACVKIEKNVCVWVCCIYKHWRDRNKCKAEKRNRFLCTRRLLETNQGGRVRELRIQSEWCAMMVVRK